MKDKREFFHYEEEKLARFLLKENQTTHRK